MVIEFVSTLAGAFLGVSIPFAIDRRLERDGFETLMDAAFVLSDAYAQGVRARTNYILQEAQQAKGSFSVVAKRLIAKNIHPPEGVIPLLVTSHAKFLRPQDVFLIAQSEQNLLALHANLDSAADAGLPILQSALDGLLEHGARRSWLIHNAVHRTDEEFSVPVYNRLTELVSKREDKRVSKVAR